MSKRDKIKMTDEEVAAFLAANRKVQIATIGKDGMPHLVTMYYALYEGKIAFTTYMSSQKVVNLRRNPLMSCLVEDGVEYNELRGVSLQGKGIVSEDPDVRWKVGSVVGSQIAGFPPPVEGEPLDPMLAAGLEKSLAKRVTVIME